MLVFAGPAAQASARDDTPDGAAPEGRQPASSVLPVEVTTVALQEAFEVRALLAGRVVSRRTSRLGFERSGRLDAVLVDEGARVEQGAVLARLDTRELRAQQRELHARVDATRARLELATLTTARREELRAADYLPPQDLDEARSNERALAAQLAADRAALERIGVALELAELRAPYAAVVVARELDEGTVAAAGETVLRILERGAQEVRVGVPPDLAASLETGAAYSVEIGERAGRARLRSVLPELDPATRTQTAILELEAGGEDAAPWPNGALARLALDRDVPSRGAWLPVRALAEGRRGTWTAYAVAPDDDGGLRVERRQVEVIHTEGERAYVRGTLRDGDRIVADGVHRLFPGLRVRIAGEAVAGDARAADRPS